MTLAEYVPQFLEYLEAMGRAPKTLEKYRCYLPWALALIGNKDTSQLRLVDVARVVKSGRLHGIYGPKQTVICYRVFLKWLHDSNIPLLFDWRDIDVPNVPQNELEYLTSSELNIVRKAIPLDKPSGLRMRAFIEMLLDTGMRISEALSVDQDDIDWRLKEIKITNGKTRKKNETVYLTKRSIYWLKRYLARCHADHTDCPALFAHEGKRLSLGTARQYLWLLSKKLPIKKKFRSHIFRRTLATKLQERVDFKTVQTILRHRSERTTLMYYVGVNQERAKRLHQKVMGA